MKKIPTVAVMLLALIAAGCATSPVSHEDANPAPPDRAFRYQEPPAGDHGILVVTRDTGFMGAACNTLIYIDGEKSAEIAAGETVSFYIPAGTFILGANSRQGICGGGLKEREVTLHDGDTRRYRVSIDTAMSMDLAPTAF